MLLTEAEIAAAAGLPGPVIAELFAPVLPAPADAAVYLDEDAVKARIAAMMLGAGIRWQWVQVSVAGLPDDPVELARLLHFWARRTQPDTRTGRFVVAAVAVAAILLGILVGCRL